MCPLVLTKIFNRLISKNNQLLVQQIFGQIERSRKLQNWTNRKNDDAVHKLFSQSLQLVETARPTSIGPYNLEAQIFMTFPVQNNVILGLQHKCSSSVILSC